MARFDYVTVGHVTVDVLVDGEPAPEREPTAGGVRQPGGGAFYSALQAARLGLRTLILTQGVPQEIEALLAPYGAELEVRVAPAASTTTLLTYAADGRRRQRLAAWAGPIAPPRDLDTAILHLAPVARETPSQWDGRAEFVGLTPQGLVRSWDDSGEMVRGELLRELLPGQLDAVVLSADELAGCDELLPASPNAAADGPVTAVTAGAEATVVHLPGGAPLRVPPRQVLDPREDLGAGDVFAAAFFVALHEGQTPASAAAFAHAAAALRVEGVGAAAIGTRAAVQARLGDRA